MIDKTGSLDLFLYADDLKICNEINTDEDVEALQQDLDRLYDWTLTSQISSRKMCSYAPQVQIQE